jgi:hypothetical protein
MTAAGVLTWACLVGVGVKHLSSYATTPGEQEAAPPTWPVETSLAPTSGRSTLVMFVHPKCPCSRASLSELNLIMNADDDHASAFVVFLRPSGVAADWERTDTWESAGIIPRATRIVDRDGAEARRFGALTSGHVVLYDPDGHLQYAGGITESRGHAGNNVGRETVLELLANGAAAHHGHSVFGCPLGETASAADVSP